MTDESDDLAPSEAFGTLGDETRVAILEALAETLQDGDTGLSFSELRKRAGVRDAGQFNYHLSKLRDRFVVKREDGYYARYAALRAVGAIRSGAYTEMPEPRTAETDETCPECGASLTAEYDHGFFSMTCDEHDTVVQTAVPPSVTENRTLSEVASYVHAEVQRDLERALDGTCPICRGPVAVAECDREEGSQRYAVLSCEACWLQMQFPVAAAVIRHPAVVSLFYAHDVDIRTRPLMGLEFVRDPDSVTVVDEDAGRMAVEVALGDDSVSLTLDADLNVVAVEES